MNKKNVCIIGAGISGLTAGALLIKKGFNVTIYEKEQFIGGRALSFDGSKINFEDYNNLLSRFNMNVSFSKPPLEEIFKKGLLDGYKLDLGYHAIGGGVLSNTNNMLSEFNEHIDIKESNVGLIKEKGYDYPFLSKLDKIKIAPKILRLLFASEKTLKNLDKVSISETIKRYGKGKMRLILEVFSRSISTINNLDFISTGEMFRAQKNLYRGSKPVGYPIGGLSSITKKFADCIKVNGGHIYLSKTVEKIIIKNNKAVGVIVDGKKIDFDIIISSILVQDLYKIVDEKQFPKDLLKEFKNLKGTGSLCAYYSLKEVDPSLIGKTFHFIERDTGLDGNDVVGMIDFMATSPDVGLSPHGNYLIQSYIICTPDEARSKESLEKLRFFLDKNLYKLIPDFDKKLNWVIYPAIWHLDGIAKTINNEKPQIKTPVDNFYLIGDCVKASGIGFNCALNSALLLYNIIR